MWSFLRRRAHAVRDALAEVVRQRLRDSPLPLWARLDAEEQSRLIALSARFLADKQFVPVQGLALDLAMCADIALHACLPILNLGWEWFDDWRTVLVYPAEFVSPREAFDAAGVLHRWEEVRGGESWQRGPVVLSWADVEASGWSNGYNVVIHEMAHKLDMRENGVADGFPPLHRGMPRKAWTAAFTQAYEALCRRVEAGEETRLDAYATESPGEFFAVVSELFFETPDALLAECPAVYRQLCAFYRQTPCGLE